MTAGQLVGVQNQSVVSTNVTPWARAAATSPLIRSGRTASARGVAHADGVVEVAGQARRRVGRGSTGCRR